MYDIAVSCPLHMLPLYQFLVFFFIAFFFNDKLCIVVCDAFGPIDNVSDLFRGIFGSKWMNRFGLMMMMRFMCVQAQTMPSLCSAKRSP